MRIAWFSPFPPARTGISGYSADALAALDGPGLTIDRVGESEAHDFVWRHRRAPYDLVVYQLGNSEWHDFIWGYVFRYPGLVVLHDARLHHARAAQLLRARRVDDYRREFAYNHPDAAAAAADYAVEDLRGSGHYRWPMTRALVESARLVAVHNDFVAQALRERHPDAHVERIRLGTPERMPSPGARERLREDLKIPSSSIVFVMFGLVTREKRIEPILRALGTLGTRGIDAHLLIAGGHGAVDVQGLVAASGVASRVHLAGYVPDERVPDYLAAGDVGLSLRWPTAEETSASWIASLAAAKPTIITSLPHTAHIPSSVAIAIDLLEEDAALADAMSKLAGNRGLRETLGKAGHEYWKKEHHVSLMADDYRRVIARAAGLPAPDTAGLPAHLTADYSARSTSIARDIGVSL